MKKSILTLATLAAISVAAQAQIIVDSVTLSPTSTGQVMQDNTNYDFASITAGSVTYSDLEGGTATPTTGSPSKYWVDGSTEPATGHDAVSGLRASTAAANIGELQIQFGQTLSNYDRFFMFDVNGDDNPTLTLIDSLGNDVGTTAYTLSSYSYGSTVYESANPMLRSSGSASSAWEFEGVSFTLADFSGTGDSSTATGFRFSGDNGMDLGKVVAAVPEPSSALLLLLGLGCLVSQRRRRAA